MWIVQVWKFATPVAQLIHALVIRKMMVFFVVDPHFQTPPAGQTYAI